jgi:hypothetical protein
MAKRNFVPSGDFFTNALHNHRFVNVFENLKVCKEFLHAIPECGVIIWGLASIKSWLDYVRQGKPA